MMTVKEVAELKREVELIKQDPAGALRMIKLRNKQLVEAGTRIAELERKLERTNN